MAKKATKKVAKKASKTTPKKKSKKGVNKKRKSQPKAAKAGKKSVLIITPAQVVSSAETSNNPNSVGMQTHSFDTDFDDAHEVLQDDTSLDHDLEGDDQADQEDGLDY